MWPPQWPNLPQRDITIPIRVLMHIIFLEAVRCKDVPQVPEFEHVFESFVFAVDRGALVLLFLDFARPHFLVC